MVNKTYRCKVHGEFTTELDINKELTECLYCKEKVKRVFKPIPSKWNTGGACGKVGN